MAIWLLVFGFMALIMGAMAVGVLMGRKPIAGSCGGAHRVPWVTALLVGSYLP